MPHMKPQHMLNLCQQIFYRHGASQSVAHRIAQALVRAQLDGQSGHGLVRVPSYAGQLRSGKVDGTVLPTHQKLRAGFYHICANGGFAYPALDLAQQIIEKSIVDQGIVAVGINQSHHCGVAGHVVEDLANKGMMAMLFSNAPKAIAPWGGSQPLFGTNPLAFAVGDVVVDMAMSVVARGKLIQASKNNEKIPTHWAIDTDGNPTDDAGKAMAGCMLPFGGAKGYAITVMIEILTAVLCQAHFSFEADSFLNTEGTSPNVAQLIIAIDTTIINGDYFAQRLTQLISEIKHQDGTRIPGENRKIIRERNKNGMDIDDNLYRDLKSLLA